MILKYLNERPKTKLTIYVTISLVGACVIVIMYRMNLERYESLRANGSRVPAVLSSTSGKRFTFTYSVGDKEYSKSKKKAYSNIYDSEIYNVAYNQESPSEGVLLLSEPVLDESYTYESTEFISTRKQSKSYIFHYQVDGKEYARKMYTGPDDGIDFAYYEVKYRLNDPKIGYLIRKDNKN